MAVVMVITQKKIGSDVRENHAPEVHRKQKWVNVEEITVLDNSDSLPSQEQNVLHYSDTKDTFVMNWHTDKKNFRWKSPCRNVTTVRPSSRSDAKNVLNPLESFLLFISGDMVN